jgi:transcriptional regulator with XRE-family HTH domain
MIENSSTALAKSQGTLHCLAKGALYPVVMSMGTRIKAARKRLHPKVTQKDVAAAFGITEQAVSGWERDEDTPGLDKMPKLRDILKVPYAWLIEGGDTPPPAVDDPEVLIEARQINLFRKERRRVA